MEEWRRIDSVCGDYMVSSHGRIMNAVTGRVLKTHINKLGRVVITLAPNGRQEKKVNLRVHRCVALAFLGEPSCGQEVNHKDGNPQNNHVDNLEWCSRSENIRHAYDTCLMLPRYGHENHMSSLTPEQVKIIRENLYLMSDRAYARLFGVHHTTVGRCRKIERYKQ